MTQPRTTAPFGDWRRTVAIALWAALAVIALVLLWRRLAGAFSVELGGLPACTFSTLAAIFGVIAWLLHATQPGRAAPTRTQRAATAIATLAPVVLLSVALFPRGSSSTAAYLTVLLLLTAATLAVLELCLPAKIQRAGASASAVPEGVTSGQDDVRIGERSSADLAAAQGAERLELAATVNAESNGSAPAAAVSQWLRREALPDGAEQIEGGNRLSFGAGQKHAVLHLAFTPALASVPTIECEPLDSADVELKVAAVYPYGARIEARRQEPLEEPLEVEIGYMASVAPESTASEGADSARSASPNW